MLMYSLGRALKYSDVQLVDDLVARLQANGGRPSELITGIIESNAFQRTQREEPTASLAASDR
jgi:hypothetical protein